MLHPNRQSGLPRPKDARGTANNGMPAIQMGRVTYVHWLLRRVDVLMDDGTLLEYVRVANQDEGPDRGRDKLPRKRTLVGVVFPYNSKVRPFVGWTLGRQGKELPPPKVKGDDSEGVYREIFPSGVHLAVYDSGEVEMRTADGTFIAFSKDGTCRDDLTGQDTEAADGHPFKDPAPVPGAKPPQFQLVIKQPDGTTLTMKDGTVTVDAPSELKFKAPAVHVEATNATVKASSNAKVEAATADIVASGGVSVEGSSVSVKGHAVVNVEAPLLRLNNGFTPIARISDVAFPSGPGNLTVLA